MSYTNNIKRTYIYLHGFASGIASEKAQFFKQKFDKQNINLLLVDLNQNDFTNITLTKQLSHVENIINNINNDIILLGSSMGGLIASMIADKCMQVKQLILLAPAFEMSNQWSTYISEEQHKKWQHDGAMTVFHHGESQEIPLKYGFLTDLNSHDTKNFKRQINSIIFHGIHDNIIPIQLSHNYIKNHYLAQLVEIDDDHSLCNHLENIWTHIKVFCKL